MDPPKEGSGKTGISAPGKRLMKVKQEIGEKMKRDKKEVKDSIAGRVSKRVKKKEVSGGSTSPGPHSPSSLKIQEVVNLMVQAHGQKELARVCSSDETPETAPEGWFCIHEKYISKCHLRFPLPDLLLDLLDHYQLALSQLCPSVIRVINGFITRAKEEGVAVGLTELMSLYTIKESSSKDGGSGTYYLPCRPRLGLFKSSGSDDDWRKKYFYVKIDPSTVPLGRALSVIWSDISDIEDPPKLSDKLSRALFRKLHQSPNTWASFTVSRIGSARFPDRYNSKFLDPIPAEDLEVSEGPFVVDLSTGASTSETEKTQAPKMRPSFRSRNKPAAAASASRCSDKTQRGAFLSSLKEVLDDGSSVPAKDVSPVEPRAQDIVPGVEVPTVEANPQAARGPLEVEPPRNKRSRTDLEDRPARSSSSSSRGGTVGWNFSHSKPGSILDDPWGLATIMRHMKMVGCSMPSINGMTNKEEYVEIAHHVGQLAGAINRAQLRFEETVHGAHSAGDLAQATELFKTTKMELDLARARVSELEAEVGRLGSKADTQQGKIESQAIDIRVKNRKINELDAARRIAEHQVQELIVSSQVSQQNKEAEVKLAVRKGKKEVAEAYNKILISVKEKFVKKKEETDALIYAQELQANTELLKDLLSKEIENAEEEYHCLMVLIPDAGAACEKAQVSDFSVSKLPIPQFSESSGTFEINMFNPTFPGEYGSNMGSVSPDLVPVETTPGGVEQDVEVEVPVKGNDPIEEDKDDEADPGSKEG
ncbi:meiosis-specific protein ASY2-like [Raphanus sativus]|uniref:Meiosis-specific protein ASY2-like n=1 Tax=Raphanus sativus TaxID=3726 RepID=A0A9W3C416_RAPSA|nr:meiosis-specific protein ASY2-like [Raphanus sativus]